MGLVQVLLSALILQPI